MEIDISSVKGSLARLRLVYMLGRVIWEQAVQPDRGESIRHSIPLRHVRPGAYLLHCTDGISTMSIPVIKR